MPSGSTYIIAAGSNYSCVFSLSCYEKSGSVDIAKNTSVVHADWSATYNSNYFFSGGTRNTAGYLKISVDGQQNGINIPLPSGTYNGQPLGSGSADFTVAHNEDGSRSITVGITMDQGGGNYSGDTWVWAGTGWSNATLNLTTIPRTSNISLSTASLVLNGSSSVVINTNRASSSFTHTIQQNFSGSFVNLATGIGDSYTWIPPTGWYSTIGNGSKQFTIRLITYSGSTQIGYTDASFTVSSAGISQDSLSASSIILNGSNGVTIYTNRKSDSFTHTIQQNINDTFVDIATGVIDSTAWTPANTYYPIIGGGYKDVTIRCITYSGSTTIGQSDVNLRINSAGADAVSLSNTSMIMGTAYKINVAQKNDDFKHTVTWTFKSASGQLGEDKAIDTSVDWTPSIDLSSQITTSMSGNGTVTCQTFYGTTSIGTTTVNFNLSVPDYNVILGIPTITEEGTDAKTPANNLTTYGIKNTEVVAIMSVKRLVVSATTSYNATMSNISVTFGSNKLDTSGNTDKSTFNNTFSGMLNGVLSITATDSRGRTLASTYSQTYTFRNYFLPSVTAFSGDRTTQTGDTGTLNANGTFWNATAGTTANTLTGAISPSATGTATIVPKTDNTWSTSFPVSGVTYTNSYDFTITVTDSFGNKASKSFTLPISVPVMWKGKHTVRIRKFLIVERVIKTAKLVLTEALTGVTATFSGTVTAPTFKGDLSGNATSATSAKSATTASSCTGNSATATSSSSCTGNSTTATTAAKLGRGANTSVPMTFNWSGQSGQPSWLWGGNDGTNMYIYNPSNFSVNYANTAGKFVLLGQRDNSIGTTYLSDDMSNYDFLLLASVHYSGSSYASAPVARSLRPELVPVSIFKKTTSVFSEGADDEVIYYLSNTSVYIKTDQRGTFCSQIYGIKL